MRFDIVFLGLPQDEETVGAQTRAYNKGSSGFHHLGIGCRLWPQLKGTADSHRELSEINRGSSVNCFPHQTHRASTRAVYHQTRQELQSYPVERWKVFSSPSSAAHTRGVRALRGRYRCQNQTGLASTLGCWSPNSSLHWGSGGRRDLTQIGDNDCSKMNGAEY